MNDLRPPNSGTPRARVFSGIQPSGSTHLGNLLGALVNWVALQDEDADTVYCIVDLHALTLPKEPGEVAKASIDVAKMLMAVGVDPDRSTFFVQSNVSQHAELGWLMQCYTAFGELNRMTQFKDKTDTANVTSGGFISAGLFSYPSLQAADILLYDTTVVPVGDDQRQHIELTRDIAMRFNSRFGETLVIPEHKIPKTGARVMDLQRPDQKMSKSLNSPQGTVDVLDDLKQVERKIKRAVTDNDGEVRFDIENKPGVSNLLSILGAATGVEPQSLAANYEQYGPLKADTAAAVIAILEPIQARYEALSDDDVVDALRAGADKAREVAEPVMTRVKNAIGLL